MAKEAVLESVNMSLGEDGILRIKVIENAAIGLSQAKLQVETIRRLCGDRCSGAFFAGCGEGKIAVIIDARASHEVTKEAQEYFAQHVGNRIATAVLASSPIAKISLNLYLSIFKPSTPYKLFNSEAGAVEWLKQQTTTEKV